MFRYLHKSQNQCKIGEIDMKYHISGFPHFSNPSFKDFSRSKLRYSRTIVCGKNALGRQRSSTKIFHSTFICTFQEFLGFSRTC